MNELTPFEQRIVSEVRQVWRNTRRPARTAALAARLNTPERTMLYWLNKAEAAGEVYRPSERGGWLHKDIDSPQRFERTRVRWVPRLRQLPLPILALVETVDVQKRRRRRTLPPDPAWLPRQLAFGWAA